MLKRSYIAVGLMSGTSLDGVDITLARYSHQHGIWKFTLLDALTIRYPDELQERLRGSISFSQNKINQLDEELGEFFADGIISLLKGSDFNPDIIGSHGHTIFHRPSEGLTLQVGNGEIMARKTGIKVVNDFRSYDVKLGGQGAPLVPVGDRDLFTEYDLCLNLGGFSNISYTDRETHVRMACDIGPCNMLLNHLSEKLGQPYDSNGLLARGGEINQDLLAEMNSLSYYDEPAPKSLGKEWFTDHLLPLVERPGLNTFDLLATATEHIAFQISQFIKRIRGEDSMMLISGGGAYNSYLLEKIRNKSTVTQVIPNKNIIEYKEALIFAYLGILRVRNEINIISSVTGASRDSSSGRIHNPK